MDFKGKKITIMGLGILGGGVGSAEFFARKGAYVTVTDLRDENKLKESIRKLSKYNITYVLGRHRKRDFIEADMIIRNPAIPLNSPFLALARKNNIPIEMAESIFMKLSPTKNIIGITGTRGKSTTSAMVYHILQILGKETFLSGNQKDTSTLLLLDKVSKSSFVILELSSWQIESFEWSKISPHISLITNIYPDHLDRYNSMKDYVKAKAHICMYQKSNDILILNHENAYSSYFAKKTKGRIVWFSKNDLPKNISLSVYGEHNRENASAALCVSSLLGLPYIESVKALSLFKGLSGRLEYIGAVKGVKIINDTTSTTPTACEYALSSFPAKKIILLIGGNTKNLPIDSLVNEIQKRVKALIYLKGNATDILKRKLKNSKIPAKGPYSSLDKTFFSALSFAEEGDFILFSPAFTSFGQFANEFERGEAFAYAVKKKLLSQ